MGLSEAATNGRESVNPHFWQIWTVASSALGFPHHLAIHWNLDLLSFLQRLTSDRRAVQSRKQPLGCHPKCPRNIRCFNHEFMQIYACRVGHYLFARFSHPGCQIANFGYLGVPPTPWNCSNLKDLVHRFGPRWVPTAATSHVASPKWTVPFPTFLAPKAPSPEKRGLGSNKQRKRERERKRLWANAHKVYVFLKMSCDSILCSIIFRYVTLNYISLNYDYIM